MDNPRLGAACGIGAVIANISAVAALATGVSSAYRVDEMSRWIAQAQAAPGTSDLAALLFGVGCAAFVPFGLALGRAQGSTWGGRAIALAGLLNVVGPVFTIVATRAYLAEDDVVESLFRRAIELDAAFNAALGVGLILIGLATWRASSRKVLGAASVVVGAVTLPVALQFFSGSAARWLAVAGPLWLCLLVAWSVALWRSRR